MHRRAQKFQRMKKEIVEYESPRMEYIIVEVESGFAGSGEPGGDIDDMPTQEW